MSISKTKKAKLIITMPNNCWYCGTENPSTVDHVKPKFHGGDDSLDNLVLACKSCNSSKRALSILQYRFHCSWKDSKYGEIITSGEAKRLINAGVSFPLFTNNHKFWFEGI